MRDPRPDDAAADPAAVRFLKKNRGNLFPLLLAAFLMLSGFSGTEAQTAEETGVSALLEAEELLTEEEKAGDVPIDLASKLERILSSGGLAAAQNASAHLAALLGVLLLSSLLRAVGELSRSEGLRAMCDYATLLAVSGVTYSVFGSLFRLAGEALNALTAYMAALLPVTGAVLTAGGTPTAAATSAAAFSLFLSCVSLLSSSVLFPFLQVSFSLCFAGAVPGAVDLSPIASLVKNTAAVLLAFLYTTLGFLVGLQSTVSAAADGYVFRTVKFASGVFIPVVGGMLGDAARTVAGGIAVIRGTVGTVGVVATLAVLLPPMLVLIAHRFVLSLCASLAKMLGCAREGQMLSDLGGVAGLLFGTVAGAEAVTVLYLACFIRTSAL